MLERCKTCMQAIVLVVFCMFLVVYRRWVYHSTTYSTLPSTTPTTQPAHPALSQACFRYRNVSANNTCCQMFDYHQGRDVLQCAEAMFRRRHPDHQFEYEGKAGNGTAGTHWALVGDSHLRYILAVLLQRLHETDHSFEYRIVGKDLEWNDLAKLLNTIRKHGEASNIEVRHKNKSFSLTWYFDPLLLRLPELTQRWLQAPPSFVFVNSALHLMRATGEVYKELGAEATLVLYRNRLETVVPSLTSLVQHTSIPVVFKLLDDVLDADPDPQSRSSFSAANARLYNRVAQQALAGTGVVLWDSCLPLSRAYTAQCRARPKTTPVTFWWKCADRRHVGYMLVDQYVDMILNHVCNRFMDLPRQYCP